MTQMNVHSAAERREHTSGDLAPPPRGAALPDSAEQSLLRQRVVDALRAMLDQAEARTLDARTTEAGVTIMLEHGNVRAVLVVCPQEPRHALSPRELQIARLVAAGDTNRAIASTLDISLWTVSTHMRRIFAKLGVGSRAEMVALFFGAATSR